METTTDLPLVELRFSLLRAVVSAERALSVDRAVFAAAAQYAMGALHHAVTLRSIAGIDQPELLEDERALVVQLQDLCSRLLKRVAASPSGSEVARAIRLLLGALEPAVWN